MYRRFLTASIVSIAMAASSLTVVAQAATTPTTAVTQTVSATSAATQTTSPSLTCGTGLVGTVCAIVLGPICRDRCLADTAPQTASTTGTGAMAAQRSVAAPAASTSAATPTFACAPEIQIVCDVLGLVPICKDKCFANWSSAPTASLTRAQAIGRRAW
jgi:hypothetical protein